MAVESIGATNTSSASSELTRAGLGQDDFLKVLLTQLTFQDPLEPMDNQEFIAQMAQFTNLEQSRQTNEKIDTLLAIESSNQSLNLLGKTVQVTTLDSFEIGTVSSIKFSSGVPEFTVLKADNSLLENVSLSQISRVSGG